MTGQSTVKAGINALPTVFTLQPPTSAGNVISYLVQASLDEFDTTPIVLPYYNAANPAQPFVGPADAGTSQNTQRVQRVGLACKPGVAATAGTQSPPPPILAGSACLWSMSPTANRPSASRTSRRCRPLHSFPGGCRSSRRASPVRPCLGRAHCPGQCPPTCGPHVSRWLAAEAEAEAARPTSPAAEAAPGATPRASSA